MFKGDLKKQNKNRAAGMVDANEEEKIAEADAPLLKCILRECDSSFDRIPASASHDVVALLFATLAQRIATNARSPAPRPIRPPSRRPVHIGRAPFTGREQEQHTGGHEDVPNGMRVEVVVLRLGKHVQAHPDESTQYSGDEVEEPSPPGRRVTLATRNSSVHLSTQKADSLDWDLSYSSGISCACISLLRFPSDVNSLERNVDC